MSFLEITVFVLLLLVACGIGIYRGLKKSVVPITYFDSPEALEEAQTKLEQQRQFGIDAATSQKDIDVVSRYYDEHLKGLKLRRRHGR